jgi:PAS domain S-box-containing protein
MKLLRLRTKFLAGSLGLVMLLGLGVIVFVRTELTSKVEADLQKRGLSIARDFAEDAVNPLLTENVLNLQLIARDHKQNEEDIEYFFVENPIGEVLVHTFGEKFPSDLRGVNPIKAGQAYSIRLLATEKQDVFDIAMPILNGDLGTAHVGMSAGPVRKGVADIIRNIVWIIIGVLALGGVVVVLFALRITKPLAELTKTANIVGRGDLGRRIEIKTMDEIGHLAATFNKMVDDLQQTTVSRSDLEAIVHQRTVEIMETNAKLQALIQAMPDSVYFKDCNGRYMIANKALEELLGANEGMLIGKTEENFMPPDLAAYCKKSDEELIKSRRILHAEEAMTGRDGQQRYFDTVKAPIYNSQGGLLGLVGVSRDVTERRLKDEAIRESEERFRGAFENAAVGASMVDLKGRFIKVNRKLCEMLGYSEEELLSKTFSDVTHPDDISIGLDALADLVAGKVGALSFEKRYICRDGRVIHVNVSPAVIRDRDGKPVYCLGLFQDVTERKRAAETIGQLSSRNEMILKSAGEGICGIDREGVITFVNPAAARMTGWNVEELIGKSQHDVLHHSQTDGAPHPREKCLIYAPLKDGVVHRVTDEVFWRKDGTSFPVDYVSTPLREGGAIVGAVVVFNDISERKHIEDALRALAKRAREEKAKTEAIIAALGDGISIQDTDLKIIFQNQALKDITGSHIGEYCYKAYQHREDICENCHLMEIFKDGKIRKIERTLSSPEGTKYFEITSSPLRDATGMIIAGVELSKDITERKKAEEVLRQQRVQLDEAQRIAHVGSWERDVTSNRVSWSDEFYRMIGFNPREIEPSYDVLLHMIHPDDREGFVKAGKEAVYEKKPYSFDYRLLRRDGTTAVIHASGEVIYGQSGTPTLFRGTAQDITERKKAEESLLLFRNLLNQTEDAIFVNDPATGRFLMVNTRACSNLGYGADTLLLMRTIDIEAIFPDQASWDAHVNEVRSKGNMIVEGVHKRNDGTAYPVEVSVTYLSTGEKDYMVAVARDITERKLSEQALRLSEERLSRAQKMAHVGNWSWNIVTNDLYWSEEVYHIYGVDPAKYVPTFEAVGKAMHPDDLGSFIKAVDAAIYERKPFEMDYRLIRPDGRIRTVHTIGEVTYDPSGKPLIKAGTVQDITERKQAEEALYEANQTVSSMIRYSPLAIICMDTDSEVLIWNPAAERIFGWKEEEVLGRKNPIVPESREEEYRSLAERVRQGEPYIAKELVRKKKDGTLIHLAASSAAIHDTDGKTVASFALFEDITERHRMEAALRKSEANYRSLLEQASDGIAVIDRQGRYLDVNSRMCDMMGYSRDEFLNLTIKDVVASEDQAATPLRLPELLAGKTVVNERFMQRKDGSTFPMEISAKMIPDGRLCGIHRDISERKQVEEALKAAMLRAKQEKTKSDAVISAIGDQMVIIDSEFKVLYQNKLAIENIGDHVGEICHKAFEDKDSVCEGCPVALSFQDGLVHRSERLAEAIIGTMHLDITASPLKDASGNVTAVIEMVKDISDRKRAEETLRKSHVELEVLVGERTAELRMINEQLSMFSSYLQEAREKERTSIAREIHDELGQALTALKMDLSWMKKRLPKNLKQLLEKESSMSELVDSTIQTVKKISSELRPGILDHLGLTAAIEWQAEEFQKRTGIRCGVSIVPEEIVPDRDRSTTIFRIFQETLTNITRHAKATEVSVRLEKMDHKLLLEVRDNGRGITEKQLADPKSLGLMGMRERAAYWGGGVKMKGVRGSGTTVSVYIPLDRTGGVS